MAGNKYLTGTVVLALVVVWSSAILFASVGPSSPDLSPGLIIGGIGAFGTLGILTIQIIRVFQQDPAGRDQEPGSSDSVVADNEGKATDGANDGQRVTATSGLSPTERQVQNTLLKEAYLQFAEGPFRFHVMRSGQPLVEAVSDLMGDVEDETMEKVWRFTRDDGVLQPTAWWERVGAYSESGVACGRTG